MDDSSVSTASDPAEPQPVLEYEPLRERRWYAGTLTYTFAGLVALFFWLLWGDFALNLKERSVPPTLQLLLKHFNASDLLLGVLVTSLPQAMALVVTPIISYQSDRLRTRWGRRIPFLFATAPLAFLSMVGLAYSPVIGRWLAHSFGAHSEDAAIVASLGVFWGVFELCSIVAAFVVFPGLINDVVPRPVLGRFYGLFRIVSLGAGMVFNWFFMGKVEQYFVPIFLTIGALYGLSFALMCLKVREPQLPPASDAKDTAAAEANAAPALGEMAATGAMPAAGIVDYQIPMPPASRTQRIWTAIETYFAESFGIPYYYWFFASFALATMAFTPINSFSIPFCLALGMSRDTYGKLSTLQFALSLAQAYPVGWLCDRFHPLRITIVSLALYAVLTMLAFVFVRNTVMFGAAHVLCGTVAGFWLTATAPLGPALLPKNRFTQFLSATHICTATGVIVIAAACGRFLDVMHHDYRYMYLWASVLVTASLIVSLVLYRQFMARGGPEGYVAPEK
jgi:MFS family permease